MILLWFMMFKRISNRLLKKHLKRIKKCVTKNTVKFSNINQIKTRPKKTESEATKWSTKLVSVKQQWTLSNSNNLLKQRKNKRARKSSIHKVNKVPKTCLLKLLTKSNRFSQFNKDKPCFYKDFKPVWWTNTEATLSAKIMLKTLSCNWRRFFRNGLL